MTYRPSRFEAMKVYSKRALRWRSNSWPYLSADAFADFADVVFMPPKFRGKKPTLKEVKRAQVIFVNSAELLSLLEDFGSSLEAKVIISGNSDAEFHHSISLPKSLKCLLLQNSFISDQNRIFTLPIGLENYRLGLNGNPRFISEGITNMTNKSTLFGPFSDTHPVRLEVKTEFFTSNNHWDYIEGYISPPEYNKLSAQYEHVACVRGNGVDTHRFWETLYRGRTPIVVEDSWSNSLDYLQIPFKKIESWRKENLIRVTQTQNLHVRPKLVPQLWMPFWVDFIKNKVS